MERLPLERLKEIAQTHSINYEILEPENERVVSTRLSRTFKESQENLYNIMADLKRHEEYFDHCAAEVVVDKTGLDHILPKNQFIVVSDVAEGGSKLAISRYTLYPSNRIEEDLITDPFPAEGVIDSKKGKISWVFEKADNGYCRMTAEGRFEIATGQVFVRGLIDHVWLSFFENIMIEIGELNPKARLTIRPSRERQPSRR